METAAAGAPATLKHKRGQPMTSGEKAVVLNVYDNFLKTYNKKSSSELAQLTADTTGVSVRSVYRLRKERHETGTLRTPSKKRNRKPTIAKYDVSLANAMRSKVRGMLLAKEEPTKTKLLEAINDDPELPNFKYGTFCKILQEIGIRFPKSRNENGSHSKFWRQQLKNLRHEILPKTMLLQNLGTEPNVGKVAELKIGGTTGQKSISTRTVFLPENSPQRCLEGNNLTNMFVDDLQIIVQYLLMDSVSISFQPDESQEKVWAIQGPKKNLTVKLHYRVDDEPDQLTSDEHGSDEQDSCDELDGSDELELNSIAQSVIDDRTGEGVLTRVSQTLEQNASNSFCLRNLLSQDVVPACQRNEVPETEAIDCRNRFAIRQFIYENCTEQCDNEETILPDLPRVVVRDPNERPKIKDETNRDLAEVIQSPSKAGRSNENLWQVT